MYKLILTLATLYLSISCFSQSFSKILLDQIEINYSVDGFVLSEQDKNKIHTTLQKHQVENISIEIESRADSTGSIIYNEKLSNRRTKEIKDHLVTIGVTDGKITDVSFGELNPILEGDREYILYKNRSAFIRIYQVKEETSLSEKPNFMKVHPPQRKVKRGEIIRTQIVFYDSESIPMRHVKTEIAKLVKLLKANEDKCFEIQGHITAMDSTPIEDNGLSIARTMTVFDEFVRGGIDPNRLLRRGYSNKYMLYKNPRSSVESRKNRRVELKSMSCDELKLLKSDSTNHERWGIYFEPDFRFNKDFFSRDIKSFDEKQQSLILDQLRYLKEQGENPSQYSYHELIIGAKKRRESN